VYPLADPPVLPGALSDETDPVLCLDLVVNAPSPDRLRRLADASTALLSAEVADDGPIAVTLQPVVETIKLLDGDGFVTETIARDSLRQVHYPVLCPSRMLATILGDLGPSATPETLIASLRAASSRMVDLGL